MEPAWCQLCLGWGQGQAVGGGCEGRGLRGAGAALGCWVRGWLALGSACAVEAFSMRPFKSAVPATVSVGAGCHAAAAWGAAWGLRGGCVGAVCGLCGRAEMLGGSSEVQSRRESLGTGRVCSGPGGTRGIAWGAEGHDAFLEHRLLQEGGSRQGLAGAGSEVPLLKRTLWFVCGTSGCCLQHTRGSHQAMEPGLSTVQRWWGLR